MKADGFPDFDMPAPIPAPAPATCGADLMARGASWLSGKLKAHASEPIVYSRGADALALCATFGRKLFQLDDGQGGIVMEWTDRDFLVPAADLDFGAGPVLPERGDRVEVATDEGTVLVYEVLAPGGEPPWRWSDPFRRTLRIHAKHVETLD
jgi:hypothetical protein